MTRADCTPSVFAAASRYYLQNDSESSFRVLGLTSPDARRRRPDAAVSGATHERPSSAARAAGVEAATVAASAAPPAASVWSTPRRQQLQAQRPRRRSSTHTNARDDSATVDGTGMMSAPLTPDALQEKQYV